MASASPTLGANPGDSPVSTPHLLGVAHSQPGIPAGEFIQKPVGLILPARQADTAVQDGMKFLSVHILCLG